MGENKSTDFVPENANEEYALLVGRLKAFEISRMRREKSFIQKKRIAVMMDFMRVSILWIVLHVMIQHTAYFMR